MAAPPRMRRWPSPCLMLVTDRSRLRGVPVETVVSLAVTGGVNAIQLREKDLPSADVYHAAVTLHSVVRGRAVLVVNDRIDVALACGADGVHLPEDSLPVRAAREIAGASCVIGRSVHSAASAALAEEDGADYVIAGNVFETASKPGKPAAGLTLVREVAEAVQVPVIAIGGITAENAGDVIAAGADGVAVIRALLDANDPKAAAERLRSAIDAAYELPSR
jgi:thiamine-phosphate pyrophosphorylase